MVHMQAYIVSSILILLALSYNYCSALSVRTIKRFGIEGKQWAYISHIHVHPGKHSFTVNYASPRLLGSVSVNSSCKADTSVAVVQKLNIIHFAAILNLASKQFFPECNSLLDKFVLIWSIAYLFIPKLLFPSIMGHTLIGLSTPLSSSTNLFPAQKNQIIGFVDVSLQRNAGDLDALDNKPTFQRKRSLRQGESLTPYLCNLLVSAPFRKRGFGRKLVQAAEAEAASWGHSELRLHVETKSVAALCLYLGEDFNVLRKLQDGSLLYLGKRFTPKKTSDSLAF